MKKRLHFERDIETGREQMQEYEFSGPQISGRGKGKQNVRVSNETHPVAWIAVGFAVCIAFLLILAALS